MDGFFKGLFIYYAVVLTGIIGFFGLYALGFFHPAKVDYRGVVVGHTQIDCGYCGPSNLQADFHLLVSGDDGKTHVIKVVEALSVCPTGTRVHVTTGHIDGC